MMSPAWQVLGTQGGQVLDRQAKAELAALPQFQGDTSIASPAANVLITYGHTILLSENTIRLLCRAAAIEEKRPDLQAALLRTFGL